MDACLSTYAALMAVNARSISKGYYMPINLTCPINQLGYGVVSLNLLKAFEANGESPACWFLGPVEAPQEDIPLIEVAQKRQEEFDHFAASLRVYHQFDLAHHVGRGLRCGFPIFELDRFRTNEINHLTSQDALIVPTQWAADVIAEQLGGQCPEVKVSPLGVDSSIFFPVNKPAPGPTRFFNCGKWEVRKGHDVLCEAFNLAFGKDDDVELVMNCHNPCFADRSKYESYNREWERFYKTSKLGSKISVSKTRLASQRDVADLMRAVDCGVFPSFAEGWNLEASEMLAMGKKLIITNCSAHTEFCNPDNSLLIPASKTEAAHDGIWFNADDPRWNGEPGRWMEFDLDAMDALITHMRAVHEQKQNGADMFNAAGVESMRLLTWKNTANIISSFVNELSGSCA